MGEKRETGRWERKGEEDMEMGENRESEANNGRGRHENGRGQKGSKQYRQFTRLNYSLCIFFRQAGELFIIHIAAVPPQQNHCARQTNGNYLQPTFIGHSSTSVPAVT